MSRPLKALLFRPFLSQKFTMILADVNQKDLTFLADLMATGKVKPVIDRTYTLSQTADALRYLEKGHARGKVVITMP